MQHCPTVGYEGSVKGQHILSETNQPFSSQCSLLNPLKTSEKKVFLSFQGDQNGTLGRKWLTYQVIDY